VECLPDYFRVPSGRKTDSVPTENPAGKRVPMLLPRGCRDEQCAAITVAKSIRRNTKKSGERTSRS